MKPVPLILFLLLTPAAWALDNEYSDSQTLKPGLPLVLMQLQAFQRITESNIQDDSGQTRFWEFDTRGTDEAAFSNGVLSFDFISLPMATVACTARVYSRKTPRHLLKDPILLDSIESNSLDQSAGQRANTLPIYFHVLSLSGSYPIQKNPNARLKIQCKSMDNKTTHDWTVGDVRNAFGRSRFTLQSK